MKKLTDEEILEHLKSPIETKIREGAKDKAGNPTYYSYVPSSAVLDRLNEIWGINWNLEIVREIIQGEHVAVLVRLHYPTSEGMRYKDSWGGKKLSGGLELGNILKTSTSLALVKACNALGVSIADPDDDITDEQIKMIQSLYAELGKKVPSVEKFKQMTIEIANGIIADLKKDIQSK